MKNLEKRDKSEHTDEETDQVHLEIEALLETLKVKVRKIVRKRCK